MTINETNTDSQEIAYFHFVTRKEHNFLRNIFVEETFTQCGSLEVLIAYQKPFKNFVNFFLLLDDTWKHKENDFDKMLDEELSDFYYNECSDCTNFKELFEETQQLDAKKQETLNFLKILQFTYTRIVRFPDCDFVIPIATN